MHAQGSVEAEAQPGLGIPTCLRPLRHLNRKYRPHSCVRNAVLHPSNGEKLFTKLNRRRQGNCRGQVQVRLAVLHYLHGAFDDRCLETQTFDGLPTARVSELQKDTLRI